jgi:hypothetical protein
VTPGESTATQLELIREISETLGERVRWWLFGGWALDFHAGRVTRPHTDIELFVARRDARALDEILCALGFSNPAPLHPYEGQPYLKAGQEAGAWFVDLKAAGGPAMMGRWASWRLPAGSFEGSWLELDGVRARAVSLECLRELKRGFASQPAGRAPLRERDIADLALIDSLLGQQDPR